MRLARMTPLDAIVPRPSRRRRRTILSLILFTACLALLGVSCAATCRPSWYVPSSLDRSRLKSDKHDLVNLLDEIGAALNAGRPIDVTVEETQLNRWLTARAEWPVPPPEELELVKHPQLTLLDGGRVCAAGTVAWAGRSWVVSLTGRFERAAGEIRLHFESLRVGMLRVPRAWLAGRLRAAGGEVDYASRLVGQGVVALPDRGVWENGKRPFRVRKLEISQGVLRVSLVPQRDER